MSDPLTLRTKPRLIIGIDHGTTHSGHSFAPSTTKHISEMTAYTPSWVEIKKGGHVDHPVIWTLDNSVKRWDTVTLQLYACGNDTAPDTISDFGVQHVGGLKVDLKGVNWGDVPKKTAADSRSLLYRFDATLRIGFADPTGLLTFKLVRKGQELGATDFEVQ